MPHTILVVEDEFDVRENISEILTENSYRVITASNGREAVIKLLKETPDLILSDIMMPGMDGLQLLQYLQSSKNLAHIPFVFLTAKSSNQDFRKGMLTGADDYVFKPFKTNELLDVIELKLRKTRYIKEQLEEIKENIALSVPHELRTPLTPILGYSGLMVEEAGSLTQSDIEEMGSTILKSAMRLRASIEKFILYSSLQYDLNPLKDNSTIKNNATNDIIVSILSAVRDEKNYIEEINGLEIDIEKCSLKIDEQYIVLCINELVQNAFKFSDPNTNIKVVGKLKSNYYELSFSNIGCAFDSDQIKKMNLLNKQYDPTMPGSGLGLPIVKKIVEFFGGNVKILCVPERTTIVTIQLPVVDNKESN